MLAPTGFVDQKVEYRVATGGKPAGDQLLPHSIEAEQALLGAILIDTDKMLEVSYLQPRDFFLTSHGKLYEIIKRQFEKHGRYDYVTILEALDADDALADFNGPGYLAELTDRTFLSMNADLLAEQIYTLSVARQVINRSTQIVQKTHQGPQNRTPEEIVNEAIELLVDIDATRKQTAGPRTINKVVDSFLDNIQAIQAGQISHIATGLRDLDKLMNGFEKSKLYIMAGRPGMGKSSFAIQMAYNAAKAGKKVLLFALEMSAEDVAARLTSIESGVPYTDMKKPNADIDWTAVMNAAERITKLPIAIDDTPALTVPQMRNIAQKQAVREGLDLVIVDHIGIIEAGIRGTVYERTSYVANQVMALAKQLNLPVLTLCQLSRNVENRGDKRPCLADLRDTGKIEENADAVLFLYRDEAYNKETDCPGIAEVIIAKNRNGKLGNVSTFAKVDTSQFFDLELNL